MHHHLDTAAVTSQLLVGMHDMFRHVPAAAAETVPAAPCQLRDGQTLVVERPQGQAVICTEGLVSITLDSQAKFRIFEGGEGYYLASRERMLVQALGDAEVQFFAV